MADREAIIASGEAARYERQRRRRLAEQLEALHDGAASPVTFNPAIRGHLESGQRKGTRAMVAGRRVYRPP